jgi:hypothetical protein
MKMYEFEHPKVPSEKSMAAKTPEKRTGLERRAEPACGFTFISTVGWICRREQFRRKDDPDYCTLPDPDEPST